MHHSSDISNLTFSFSEALASDLRTPEWATYGHKGFVCMCVHHNSLRRSLGRWHPTLRMSPILRRSVCMRVRASQLIETIPGEARAAHKLISVPTHSKMYHTNDWVIIYSLQHVDNKRNCSFSDKHHIRVIISSSFHWNVRSEIVIFGYISRLSIKFKSWKWDFWISWKFCQDCMQRTQFTSLSFH